MSRSLALLTVLTLGCSGGGSWDSPDDCAALSKGATADECWAQHAPALFKADPARGVQVVENDVSDQRIRDFIWLTVTREVDPSSYKYCDKIQEEALKDRCRVLVSRPHLHRELLKEGGGGPGGPPGGAQGGPPPGGGPPPPGGKPGGPPPGAGGPPPPGGQPAAPPPQ